MIGHAAGSCTQDLPASGRRFAFLIALEIIEERQRCTSHRRTLSTDIGIGHRDSGAITFLTYSLRIDVITAIRLEIGEQDIIRMIHNRIQQIFVCQFLRVGKRSISEQQAIGVLIALPADHRRIFAHAVHREGGDRTAFRYQFHRDLRYISIVGSSEIRKEHDVSSHFAHVVSFVVLESYGIWIPRGFTEIQRIDSHEGIQVAGVSDNTYDNLVIIRRGVVAASPEIDLVFADRIHIQFRHDGIRSYITARGGHIVIQLEIVLVIMHRGGRVANIRDIR